MLKKLFSRSRKRTRAQGMVEFALALPILLVVVYGMLEAGRLLFIYSSVVSAARNAVRYASADGINPNNSKAYYQDCNGITAAANNLAFISPFSNIYITYDAGLSYQYGAPQPILGPPPIPLGPTDPYAQCSSISSTAWSDIQTGDRVNVEVQAQYSPIIAIGNLIPSFQPLTITSQSSRTLLLSIAINVTPNPTWVANNQTNTAAAATQTAALWTPTNTSAPTSGPTPTKTPITPTATNTPITPSATNTPITPSATNTPITPTATGPTPTPTKTPVGTPTSTSTATDIPNCSGGLSHGPLTYSGNTMKMTITNSLNPPTPLAIQSIYVWWNNANGHSGGSDHTLDLMSVSIGSITIWSTASNNVNLGFYAVPLTSASLPAGTSTITFTFQQSYDYQDNAERIYMMFLTNGCQNSQVDSSN